MPPLPRGPSILAPRQSSSLQAAAFTAVACIRDQALPRTLINRSPAAHASAGAMSTVPPASAAGTARRATSKQIDVLRATVPAALRLLPHSSSSFTALRCAIPHALRLPRAPGGIDHIGQRRRRRIDTRVPCSHDAFLSGLIRHSRQLGLCAGSRNTHSAGSPTTSSTALSFATYSKRLRG